MPKSARVWYRAVMPPPQVHRHAMPTKMLQDYFAADDAPREFDAV